MTDSWVPYRCHFAKGDEYCGFNREVWDESREECHHVVPAAFIAHLRALQYDQADTPRAIADYAEVEVWAALPSWTVRFRRDV